jgi:spore germination protein KC
VQKRLISLLAVLVLALLFGGCWDFMDIDEKAIVTTVLLDKQGEQFVIYVEISDSEVMSTNTSNSTGKSPYLIYEGAGDSLADARDQLNKQIEKPLYLGAVRALILTNNLTEDDVAEYFNRLRAIPEYRKKIITVTTYESPDELFSLFEYTKSVGFYIEELISSLVENGHSFYRSTNWFIEILSSKNSNFLIPSFGIQDKTLALTGYTIIHDNQSIGFIPFEETSGLLYMKAENAQEKYKVVCEDVTFTVEAKLSDKKIEVLYEEGHIQFTLQFKFQAEVCYANVRVPQTVDETVLQKLTETLHQMLVNEIQDTITLSQQTFDSDYLSFHNEFQLKYPEDYMDMDWDEEYKNVETTVDVLVDLDTQNMMDYSYNETY